MRSLWMAATEAEQSDAAERSMLDRDLQTALRELASDDSLREQLGAKGRAHILQQLSWDCVGKKMEAYYQQVLQQQAQGISIEDRKLSREQVQNAYD